MSKLSFRARALDASKPLPIYLDHEIPETADCSLINRAVPQMPTGMEKEEESEHHLQQAIVAGTVIPTPEVFDVGDLDYYNDLYPDNIKMPRQLIYMQPFSMEADIPDYDMDSEDEVWINAQPSRLELTPDKFEEMMDRLEKGSGQTVVTINEAKALIKEDDDLITAVYDYWLTKRLNTQHPLIPQVRTEARHGVTNHNPYIAFRRRTEKMQTRKNRKNDETSYEKMLKLKRDLTRALTLLEMVKRREKSKREILHLSIEVFEKRYQAGDYSGQVVAEALQQRPARPAFTPIFQPNSISWIKEDVLSNLTRKEKRQYKKRRHKSGSKGSTAATSSTSSSLLPGYPGLPGYGMDMDVNMSEEESAPPTTPSEDEDEEDGAFAFRRKAGCVYQTPVENSAWPWCEEDENGIGDKRFRFYPTSLPTVPHSSTRNNKTTNRFVGFARRRVGRGGRMVLDRVNCRGGYDQWRSLVNEFMESHNSTSSATTSTGNLSASQSLSNNMQAGVNTLEVNVDVPTEASPYSPPVSHPLSPQLGCMHYRPKSPEIISDSDALFDSAPQTSSLQPVESPSPSETSASLEDQEDSALLSKFQSFPIQNSYVGLVMPGPDPPLVFDAQTLLNDNTLRGDPLPLHTDCPSDSFLDEYSSDLFNSSYLMETSSSVSGLNSGGGDSWFNSLDVPDNIFGTSSVNSGIDSLPAMAAEDSGICTSEIQTPVIAGSSTSTSNNNNGGNSGGGGVVGASSSTEANLIPVVKVERTEGSTATTLPSTAASSASGIGREQQTLNVNVKCEIADSEECDETSVDLNNPKMRLLVDKDNKENDRLGLASKSGEGGVMVSSEGNPSISENGDEILNNFLNNASEVCTIINTEESTTTTGRDSATANNSSSCVGVVANSEHSSNNAVVGTTEVGSLLTEGIAKAIIDSGRTRTNPGGNNGQTLAMKSYTFTAPTLVRGRPSNGVVKRIGNGGNNAKTVVVEEV